MSFKNTLIIVGVLLFILALAMLALYLNNALNA